MSSKVSSPDSLPTTVPTWDSKVVGTWRQNPEYLAWTLILAGFVIFTLLAIGIPLAIRYGIRYTTVSDKAQLEPTLGTLLLYQSSATTEAMPISYVQDGNKTAPIEEGNIIEATGDSAQGTLRLISAEGTGEALGSVQLFPGTRLEILQIRRPFFARSPEPYQVRLHLERGEARIFTNSGAQRPLRVELETPHGVASLNAGSYNVAVDAAQTDITVRDGQATLMHDKEAPLKVNLGLHAWMTKDHLVQVPVLAEQNLIRNGNFTRETASGIPAASDVWTTTVIAENATAGSVKFMPRDGRNVAYFIRLDQENVHSEVSINQEIAKNLKGYTSLILQFDVNIIRHNLAGAGYQGSEFPLRVEISYTDVYGKDLHWGWGFYSLDPEPTYRAIVDGEKIAQAQWHHYQSPNLIDFWRAHGTPPARINGIRIYASGWNYQSMVSEVDLTAK
jgi:hypothetical protein